MLAIGNFDGVHAGHRALLDYAKCVALKASLPLVVLTFEPHPREILFPYKPLKRLMNLDERVVALREWGVDGVAVFPFDLEVATWSAARFLDDVVVGWLGAKHVCVGENFHFGAKASGNVDFLRADGRFDVDIVSLLADAGGVVSSTRLREGL